MNALFAWMWQGAAIALATAALLASMRRLNAASRHAIWWCALAAVLSAPIVRLALTATGAPALGAGDSALPSGILLVPAPPDPVIALAIGAWLGLFIVEVIRIAGGLRALSRLKAESIPFDSARESRLTMWQSVARDSRRPELRVSDGARAACALGLGRPVILLSEGLVDALDDGALDQVVMHEYAHLLRRDDWLRLVESAAVCVAGLHPAVRFITRKIDLEREAACDDVVVSRTGGARAYAECLADAAAVAHRSPSDVERQLVPSATGAGVSLRARVVRLLDPRRARGARVVPVAMAIGVLTVAVTVAVSHRVAPIVIVDHRHALTTPRVPPATISQAEPAAAAAEVLVAAPAMPPTIGVQDRRSAVQRAAPASVQSRTSLSVSAQLTPAEVVGAMRRTVPDTTLAPLASSNLAAGVHAPVPVAASAVPRPAAARRDASVKWSALAAPGVALGRAARSVAGFFGGSAKAVATSF